MLRRLNAPMGRYLLIVLLGASIVSCSHDGEVTNQVVVTIDGGDKQSMIEKGARLRYLDEHLIPHKFDIEMLPEEKLILSVTTEYKEIVYEDNTALIGHFLVRNGDSVLIKQKNGWPNVIVLNREVDDYESNFENKLRQDLYKDKSPASDDYFYYWNRLNNDLNPFSGSIVLDQLQYLKQKAIEEVDREVSYIDSLQECGKIKPALAEYFRRKSFFTKQQLKVFKPDGLDFSDNEAIRDIISMINDSTVNGTNGIPLCTFEDDFISLYYHAYFANAMSNTSNLDSLANVKYYSKPFGKALLFRYVDQMLLSQSVEEAGNSINSIDRNAFPHAWSRHFQSKYNLDNSLNTDWSILHRVKSARPFKDLLVENRGKVVYVDLWASWCLNSIREIPHLKKLYHDYRSNGLIIVNISVDSEIRKWEWADSQHLAFNNWNSYLLKPSDLMTVRQEFAINSIPRYLLFDTNGNLIHANAPKPSSEEIRRFLNRSFGKGL